MYTGVCLVVVIGVDIRSHRDLLQRKVYGHHLPATIHLHPNVNLVWMGVVDFQVSELVLTCDNDPHFRILGTRRGILCPLRRPPVAALTVSWKVSLARCQRSTLHWSRDHQLVGTCTLTKVTFWLVLILVADSEAAQTNSPQGLDAFVRNR